MAGTILPPAASASTLPVAQQARIAKSARDFEAMALGQMLQPMFDTVHGERGMFGGGAAEAAWLPMLANEVAKQMARHGGLGLARPVQAQLLHTQEAASNSRTGK